MIRCWPACLIALSLALLSTPARAQSEDFDAAVEALAKGDDATALKLLEKVLSSDLSNEDAYELWNRTENRVWLKLLTKGGEIELVAKELAQRGQLGRKRRQNNPDAIRELVKQLATDDLIARTKVVNQLGAQYGEFAVPILIYSLAEGSDADRQLYVIQALTRMGSDVVPPLVEAMDAPDAFLRRNVASTLGFIKDRRALPILARAAAMDSDSGVRNAAAKAVGLMGGAADAGALFIEQGDAYYREDASVLAPHQYSDVLWRWEDEKKGLVSIDVPRFLYAPEMAKKAYYRALPLLGDVGAALAGIGRCAVTEIGRLDEWMAAGQETGDWQMRLQSDELAAQLAGPDALDLALGWAIQRDDMIAASGLCRMLAGMGKSSTTNLRGALGAARSGAVQGEAAVALGSIAVRNRSAASPETVSALGVYAGKEVLRIGAVIGGDESAGRALVAQLEELGYHTSWWSSGIRGLVSLHSMPGVDLVVVNDTLSDTTAYNVVSELRTDPRLARTVVYIRGTRPDTDASAFGGKVNGVLAPGDGVAAAAEAASSEPMNRDRQEALDLAARCAMTLQRLASSGQTDVSSAAEALAGTLADRPDEIVIPAMGVLEFVGGTAHTERLASVLMDGERSDAVRQMAAQALAGIFARTGIVDPSLLQGIQGVALKDDSFDVRAATAGALGRLNLTKDVRIELMRALRAR